MFIVLKKLVILSSNSNFVVGYLYLLSKSQAQFQNMEIRRNGFSVYIQSLTGNTVIMVVLSDPSIRNMC